MQVQANTPMQVSFRARPVEAGGGSNWTWMLGLAAIIAVALALVAAAGWRPAARAPETVPVAAVNKDLTTPADGPTMIS